MFENIFNKDAFMQGTIQCPHCGEIRPENLDEPCPSCKSRNVLFFGYVFGTERRQMILVLVVAVIIMIVFVIVGVGYLLYRWTQMNAGNVFFIPYIDFI
jgi:hypothetical protein